MAKKQSVQLGKCVELRNFNYVFAVNLEQSLQKRVQLAVLYAAPANQMNDQLVFILAVLAAYLLGNVSFALVSAKLFGMADPRSYGSGNLGATNVLRSGNKLAAILTLVGDMGKGWLAVTLAQLNALPIIYVHLVAIAVLLGHIFPIFLKFKGGKGVATAAGVLFALDLSLGAVTIFAWLVTAFIFRYSSLAAIVAALIAPAYLVLLYGFNQPRLLWITIISLIILFTHRINIQRLVQGKEDKIGKK